jgi:uncharacterized DUF497 family protein
MDRLLFAVFTFRNGKIRIISARDMTVPAMRNIKNEKENTKIQNRG